MLNTRCLYTYLSAHTCVCVQYSYCLYVCVLFECNLSAEYLHMETEELLMDTQIFKSDRQTDTLQVCFLIRETASLFHLDDIT